jgi:hypothetical protein
VITTRLQEIQDREVIGDHVLLHLLLDWLCVQDQEVQERCIKYIETRASEPEDEVG